MRIEGRTKTLFEGPILTEGHAVSSYEADGGSAAEDLAEHPCDGIDPLDSGNSTPGPTATAASVDAMDLIGETQAMAGQWYPGFDDYFVKQWGAEPENAEAEGRSWGILVDNVFTNVGGCQYELGAGDEALWAYDAFAFRPFLALFASDADYAGGERPLTATAQLDVPFEVEVLAYEDDVEDSPPAHPERAGAVPFAGAKVAPAITSAKGFETVDLESPAAVTTNAAGKARITFTEPGWHRIKAGAPPEAGTGEEAAIRSNRLDVCVPVSGASGCGAAPPEDEVRVPARYTTAPGGAASTGEQHSSQEAAVEQTGTGGGEQSSGGAQSSGGPPPGPPSGQTLATSTSRVAGELVVVSVTAKRLVLRLAAAGTVTVKLARSVRSGRRRRWRTVKAIELTAPRAGTLSVALPRLSPGSYRASIAQGDSAPLVRTLVVRRAR